MIINAENSNLYDNSELNIHDNDKNKYWKCHRGYVMREVLPCTVLKQNKDKNRNKNNNTK